MKFIRYSVVKSIEVSDWRKRMRKEWMIIPSFWLGEIEWMVVPFTMVGVMKELAGLGSRQQIINVVEFEVCEPPQWRSAIVRWIYGSGPQGIGQNRKFHPHLEWVKFPRERWKMGVRKGLGQNYLRIGKIKWGPQGD